MTFSRFLTSTLLGSLLSAAVSAAPRLEIVAPNDSAGVVLADRTGAVAIAIDPNDYPVVSLAAGFFADDVERVTGQRPHITNETSAPQLVIVGTLGHSALIDRLVAAGKLPDIDQIRGRWETTLWQTVAQPFPGVQRALVIVGSDRRGTAYGLTQLSEKIGVSPWYWWSDVPPARAEALAIKVATAQIDAPAVKYRGIFINDEDWGLNPWAGKTFDPAFGNIGPKTYEKVFELLLRLRLNYFWPAMHEVGKEFASQPENIQLADRFGLVAGSSHCEPMLCNNVHWDEKTQGKWDYTLNRDAIHAYWADSTKTRGSYEAVWTMGIRGIHDQSMQGPRDIPTRINIVSEVIKDQRALLERNVATAWGPIAQCFVPYKEVLPIYDAGLKVPDDVTIVWVDDNFGYIRRLGMPAERKRSGGAGVYWHLSYYGGPHSYTWLNTTPPALMWEELHKAWDNDARRLWVINVGDIKPMEIGMDYFSRLAWNPEGIGPEAQPKYLHDFAARNFGEKNASAIADLLGEFYRLGTIRKPELMERPWALSLSDGEAAQLERAYRELVQRAETLTTAMAPEARDAFIETIGFPARVLGTTGLIFIADRNVQVGADAGSYEAAIARLKADLEASVDEFNTKLASGKWNRMMPGLVTGQNLMAWNSHVRWPWGDTRTPPTLPKDTAVEAPHWRSAATADRQTVRTSTRWTAVAGLGASGCALALSPVALDGSWQADDPSAPTLEFDFQHNGGDGVALIDFLPTFRLCPGMKLRIAVRIDDRSPIEVEVPGSSGLEDEGGARRSAAVQANYARSTVPLTGLTAGKHTLKISAMDPGAVIDRIALP